MIPNYTRLRPPQAKTEKRVWQEKLDRITEDAPQIFREAFYNPKGPPIVGIAGNYFLTREGVRAQLRKVQLLAETIESGQ